MIQYPCETAYIIQYFVTERFLSIHRSSAFFTSMSFIRTSDLHRKCNSDNGFYVVVPPVPREKRREREKSELKSLLNAQHRKPKRSLADSRIKSEREREERREKQKERKKETSIRLRFIFSERRKSPLATRHAGHETPTRTRSCQIS